MSDVVSFRLVGADPRTVVPEINGVSLVQAVAAFEVVRDHQPSGGYGGLVPEYFNFGNLVDYFLGIGSRQWPRPGRLWLLGCDCGELGCWPLEARVDLNAGLVVWTDFTQPHRPDRSYTGFGPFVFDREQYDSAVAAVVRDLAPPE